MYVPEDLWEFISHAQLTEHATWSREESAFETRSVVSTGPVYFSALGFNVVCMRRGFNKRRSRYIMPQWACRLWDDIDIEAEKWGTQMMQLFVFNDIHVVTVFWRRLTLDFYYSRHHKIHEPIRHKYKGAVMRDSPAGIRICLNPERYVQRYDRP